MTTTLAESGLSATGKDPSKVKRLHLLLYGPPKRAKTVLAHHLPRTRTLDFDNGMQSVEWAIRSGLLKRELNEIVYETILPPENPKRGTPIIDAAAEKIDEWLAEEDIPDSKWHGRYEKEWDTIIIDSASALTEAAIIKGLKENARHNTSKTWSKIQPGGIIPLRMQDWGAASQVFMNFINGVRSIGKNVVIIAHEYHNVTDDGITESIDPLVIGQLRQKLPGSFDEVWYATVRGGRKDPEFLFQTKPDTKRNLGSRLGCLDALEPADFNAIKKKVAEFYGVPESALWTAVHGVEEVKAEVKKAAKKEGAMI
jgi:hypothetical protein